jgi:D-inositol-3-phosphate glycosyltransferase
MHIVLLDSLTTTRFGDWAEDALTRRGHDVHRTQPVAASDASAVAEALGSQLAHRMPDVYLAAGWEAGVAAHLATRAHAAPVAVRLTRPARRPGSTEDRVEAALLRSSARVLVASAGERDRLVSAGVDRGSLGVLPDSIDTSVFTDHGPATTGDGLDEDRHRVGVALPSDGSTRQALLAGIDSMPACQAAPVPGPEQWSDTTPAALRSLDVVVVVDDTDAEVATTLAAMACGVPVIASDTGVLADLVADGVTGLLVGRGGTAPAIRSLLADQLGREGMGLAAVDRVRARFDSDVVAGTLVTELVALLPEPAEHAAAG